MKLIVGSTVENLHVLVESRKEALTKKGTTYLDLNVRDTESSVNAKLWDYDPSRHGFIKENTVICISALVDEFNGKAQLKLVEIQASLKEPMDFAKKSRFDIEEMWSSLVDIVGTMEEPLTKAVSEELLLKHTSIIGAIKKAPAAKGFHNAWYGGLLEHITALCAVAKPVVGQYQKYCPKLSLDKVLFGCLLHDIGKIVEYDYQKPSFDLSPTGLLVNHLVMGPAWVFEKANQIEKDKALGGDINYKWERNILMHIIAAHHGVPEWGSPVKPACLEAIIVHHLDNLDSKMMHAIEIIEGPEGPIKGFSEKSYIERGHFMQYPGESNGN